MIIAIDPGDVHVGMCTLPAAGSAWSEMQTWTTQPTEALDYLHDVRFNIDVLVVEEFRLYPWRTKSQSFSQMLTCEMIGALKLARRWHFPMAGLCMQPALIKRSTEAIMRGRKIALRGSRHAKDAQLHAYYWQQHQSHISDPSW